MGLSLVGAMMLYGTVRLDDMVRWQGENCWGIFAQPVAFFVFFAAAVAESKRIPFDLPEAESELVSGYFTEYSGMKFGMFYFAEYMEVATSSMLIVTIFLGGWQIPWIHRDGITVVVRNGDAVRERPAPAYLGHDLPGADVLRQGPRRLLLPGFRPVVAPAVPLRPADEDRLARPAPGVPREHFRHGVHRPRRREVEPRVPGRAQGRRRRQPGARSSSSSRASSLSMVGSSGCSRPHKKSTWIVRHLG